jgi:hypothetical protein
MQARVCGVCRGEEMIHISLRRMAAAILFLLCSATASWACSAVTGISPASGSAAGGTSVTISGNGFNCHTITVTFGGKPASASRINDTTITAIAPPGTGSVDVVVYLTGTPYIAPQQFTYTTPQQSYDIRDLQVIGTKTVATFSGDAISGAVGSATGDALSGGASVVTGSAGGIHFNFTAEPQRDARVEQAFNALAYAGGAYKAPRATIVPREWSVWADLRGTGFDRDNAVDGTQGRQLNVTGGIGRKLTPDIVVGAFAGYESFDFTMASISGKLTGNGYTVGGYAGWRLGSLWRFDAMLGFSDIGYDASAGLANGSFDATRWIVSGGLTGTLPFGGIVIEPSTRIYALWEHDRAWADNFGTAQAARDFSIGRLSSGGRMLVPFETGGIRVSPYVGLYGDWRFSSDNALPVNAANAGIKDGLSGRATAGIAATTTSGLAVSLGGEWGGLGAGYDLWSANGRILVPF